MPQEFNLKKFVESLCLPDETFRLVRVDPMDGVDSYAVWAILQPTESQGGIENPEIQVGVAYIPTDRVICLYCNLDPGDINTNGTEIFRLLDIINGFNLDRWPFISRVCLRDDDGETVVVAVFSFAVPPRFTDVRGQGCLREFISYNMSQFLRELPDIIVGVQELMSKDEEENEEDEAVKPPPHRTLQ